MIHVHLYASVRVHSFARQIYFVRIHYHRGLLGLARMITCVYAAPSRLSQNDLRQQDLSRFGFD